MSGLEFGAVLGGLALCRGALVIAPLVLAPPLRVGVAELLQLPNEVGWGHHLRVGSGGRLGKGVEVGVEVSVRRSGGDWAEIGRRLDGDWAEMRGCAW